jgi:hypothetical protein
MTAPCDPHVMNEGNPSHDEQRGNEIDPRRFNAVRQTTSTRAPEILEPALGPRRRYEQPKGKHSPNFGKSLRRGWAGSWGPLKDPRSKLAKHVKKIEAQLASEFDVSGRPEAESLLHQVAVWRGLEDMTLSEMGSASWATPRKAAGHARVAGQKLQALERLNIRRSEPQGIRSGAALAALWAARKAKAQNQGEDE